MEWVWKVFLAGFLATGTCGAPFVEKAPPETPPGDMMKKPDPTPPKPKPPEPTYSWQKISVPGYADGTFKKIVGAINNNQNNFGLLSKGANNLFVQVFGEVLSGFYLPYHYKQTFSNYEILDANYVPGHPGQFADLSGTTTDSGGKAFVNGNANIPFSTSCRYPSAYDYQGPNPATTNKLVAIHNGVAVGSDGVFTPGGIAFCHIFTLTGNPTSPVKWLYNDLTGVWTGNTKQFFIGKTSTGSGDFIAITVRPFTASVPTQIALDDKNGAGLNAIYGVSDTNVIAVGSDSTLLQYDGTNWNDIAIPSELGTIDLTTVYATPDGNYVIGGEGGVVLVYRDGSFNLHRLPVTEKVISVHAWGSDDIYALTENALYRFYLH